MTGAWMKSLYLALDGGSRIIHTGRRLRRATVAPATVAGWYFRLGTVRRAANTPCHEHPGVRRAGALSCTGGFFRAASQGAITGLVRRVTRAMRRCVVTAVDTDPRIAAISTGSKRAAVSAHPASP